MTIHREGHRMLAVTASLCIAVVTLLYAYLGKDSTFTLIGTAICVLFFLIILQFFRHPSRITTQDGNHVIAPADGKVVVIERTVESEYFNDERIQVSIFMSPVNVHVNRSPVTGLVKYFKYHPGQYLVAWHPKASTDNERTTVVVENENGIPVLFRQIAGALAKRIKWYVKEGDQVAQGEEFGFIKFGSRVDLFLPVTAQILVKLGDKPRGGETIIAKL